MVLFFYQFPLVLTNLNPSKLFNKIHMSKLATVISNQYGIIHNLMAN